MKSWSHRSKTVRFAEQAFWVAIGGSAVDVLAFDPRAARELLENAIGRSRLRTEFLYPPFADFRLVAEILQQQWRQALGVELELVMQDAGRLSGGER